MTQHSTGAAQLLILETSDLHGHILPIHYADNQYREVGLAKIAALIATERAMHRNVLLIDNGDLIQGTPLTYYHARMNHKPANPMVKALNRLGYDAAVLGNHEFNYGQDILLKAIRESSFPWLAANIVHEGTDRPYFGKPYLIKTLPEGAKVAVLGLTTHYIPYWENPEHLKGMAFVDAVQSAKHWVKLLREEEKADLVVVSYHGGFERDLDSEDAPKAPTAENQGCRLCEEVPGIDILLTGHQHRAIAGKTINGVAVVQPGSQGRWLGKVCVRLVKQDNRWTVAEKSSELLAVDGVPEDKEIVSMAQTYEADAQAWLDQPIGRVEGDMRVRDPMQARLKETAFIEFVNRVQLDYSGADIANTALFDDECPGFGEFVTMRDVVSNYMFPNTLTVLRVTGQDIRDALERSASYFDLAADGTVTVSAEFRSPRPQHYNYDMWEGIEYKLDISRPQGQRVVLLERGGQPLDLSAEYEVAMNNYRASGGGDYTMFQGKPFVREIPTDISELIADYILQRQIIRATVNHNWEVVWSSVGK